MKWLIIIITIYLTLISFLIISKKPIEQPTEQIKECNWIDVDVYSTKVELTFEKKFETDGDGLFIHSNRMYGIQITTPEPYIIAHESTHAAEQILKDRGIKPTGETLAYLVGYLTGEIIKCVK